MLFHFNFYSSLLLIFFVHLLCFSVLIFRKSINNDSTADRWLSLLLFFGALAIAPWMVGFAGWYNQQPYRDLLFYVPMVHFLWVGPVIYFYVQTQLNPDFVFQAKHYRHFLLGSLWVLWHLVVVVTDKIVLGAYYFLASGQDLDFDQWYQLASLASLVYYLVVSYRYYTHYQKVIFQVSSNAESIQFAWIRNFLLTFFAFVVLTLIFIILPLVGFPLDYQGDWWYFFLFGFLFYYISIEGFSNAKSNKITIDEITEQVDNEEFARKYPPIEDLENWKNKVLNHIVSQQNYTNPELSLPDLAKDLKTNTSFLSKVVNQGFGQNFNDFVNEKRVQAVIENLKSGKQKQLTLLAIAFDCGFNSKATFNRAFKKVTGTSPKDFV